MKKIILILFVFYSWFNLSWSQEFTISGTQLIDANGKNFIPRGISVPLSWFISDVNGNIVNIRNKTNANCLRIVMNTSTSDADWQSCVNKCIANKMIPEVELHDQTCGTTSGGLAAMANWWLSKKSFLTRPDIAKYILINIANEWGDWAMAKNTPASWRSAYINAVQIMRRGGIKTTLVIDAPDCGQDLNNGATLKAYAIDVFNADSLKNCLFTVHLYGEWEAAGGSKPSNLPSVKNAGIPFIVGEFAASVDDTSVLGTCQRNGIGWMAWSWKGNSDPTYTDMSYDWAGNSLTLWGNTAVNFPNGLKNTAKIASVFAGDSGCIPTAIVPNIQVNGGALTPAANTIVNIGDTVVLGPQPAIDTIWKWIGPKGFTATSREITLNNIQPNQGGYYNVSYKNDSGCISDTAIKINVVAFEAADTAIISGATYKITSKYSGKSLDLTNSSVAEGALIKQMTPVDSANQEWIITDLGKGLWKIISPVSGKALNVVKSSVTIGAAIEQRTFINLNSQKWQFIKDDKGYFQIMNNGSKQCMDIYSASTADNASMVQWTGGPEDNQKFSIKKLKDPQPGINSNPIISRGKAVYTSSGLAPYLVDDKFNTTSFNVTNNSWIAINVDSGPSKVFVNWNNPVYAWSNELAPSNCPNTTSFPVDYNFLISSNSTNGADGAWTIVDSVRGNIVTARGHLIDFSGASWVKMQIIKGGGQIDEVEIFDASKGDSDVWFFAGTSISANTYKGTPPTQNFADLVTLNHPGYNPAMIRGGIGCISSTDLKNNISKYLKMAGNAHYWAIEMGTNDAWNNGNSNVPTFKNNLQIVIDSCKKHGIQPIIAHVLATNSSITKWQVHPDYYKAVDDLTAENNLIAGPDLFNWFLAHPGELNGGTDGVHPNATGAASIQRLWAQKMDSLYGGCNSTDILPYIKVNQGALKFIANASVYVGDTVILKPQVADSGSWYWTGPVSFSSISPEVSLNKIKLTMAGNYTVTMINNKLCYSTYTFNVAVKNPVGIISLENQGSASIFPNPAFRGKFNILLKNFSAKPYLRIYDMQGKLVYNSMLTNSETEINTRLSNGIYIVKITNGYAQLKQKLIVN